MTTLEISSEIGSIELCNTVDQAPPFMHGDALHKLLDVSRLQSGTGVTVTLVVATHTRSAS